MSTRSNFSVSTDQSPSKYKSGPEKVNAGNHQIPHARLDAASMKSLAHPFTGGDLGNAAVDSPQAELEGERRPSPTLGASTEGWLDTSPVAAATATEPVLTKAEEEGFGQFIDP
jgi:hypothetical protein